MHKILAPVLLVFAAACQSAPTREQLASADYGTPIAQDEAEARATAWLQSVLKDPDSLRASWGRVEPGWQRDGLFGGILYGYRLTGDINARNSFGGYTGSKGYIFMFRDGILVHAWKLTGDVNGVERLK